MTTSVEEHSLPLGPVAVRDGAPVELAMQQLFLTGRLFAAGGRLIVRHSFVASGKQPVEAVYPFQLPRDAALRRFRIEGPGFSARSELRPAAEAAETYETGLARGHLAALAAAYRDGLVNLSVGNLRPGEPVTVWLEILAGVEARDTGFRFRFPFTVAPSYHPRARTAMTAEGAGQMELPEEEFGDALLPEWRTDMAGLHEIGFALHVHLPGAECEVASPSHPLSVRFRGGEAEVGLARAGDVPNRDLVLDVRLAGDDGGKAPAVFSGRGTDGRTHFCLLAPSKLFGEAPRRARQVVFVLDRSGSMSGEPIRQAKSALLACLGALSENDRFGLVAFDNQVEVLDTLLRPATLFWRDRARAWLESIDARGGTELASGVEAGRQLLEQGGSGELFLITDGQVWGTEEILGAAGREGVAIHTLGLGAASQDRFLALLARRTGGVSRFVSLRERTDSAALELFGAVAAPVAREVKVGLTGLDDAVIEPLPGPRVFAGSPLAVFGSAAGGGEATLELSFQRDGPTVERRVKIDIGDGAGGETLRLLRGARLITDAESGYGAVQEGEIAGDKAAERRRERQRRRLEELGREYGLANQAMSLVAVVERPGDRPDAPPVTQVVPVGLPEGMEMGGVFARRAPAKPLACFAVPGRRAHALPRSRRPMAFARMPMEKAAEADGFDKLTAIAARIEPDGGMPGRDIEERIRASVYVLLAFASAGNGPDFGPFRRHVRRLIEFLEENLPGPLSLEQTRAVEAAVRLVRTGGTVPEGRWLELAAPGHPPFPDWEYLLERL